ncbi:MAG: M24 family metallopeptidase [Candidatus Glassbacteria bacterium]
MKIQEEKVLQAVSIMNELAIDMWITLVRESETNPDPVLELILGKNVTWLSAFIFTREGERIALVGSLDEPNVSSAGLYTVVKPYVESLKEDLLETIERADPKNIALNYSTSDVLADGLSHGVYLTLTEYLADTPYLDRIISSEKLISALRGRKSPEELERIGAAITITEDILSKLTEVIRPGLTEKDIAHFILHEVKKRDLEAAWDPAYCPSVFTGPESAGAHYGPTDRKIEPGHILNVDFGVRYLGYCSDMQRTWYVAHNGEESAPEAAEKAFMAVRDAVKKASSALEPGIEGWKVDDVARSHITSLGYEEYPHALGHQIGRKAHDGSGLLCPRWERYGELPYAKVEKGQVYTLEPRVTVEGYGVATVEEIAVVEEQGCRFLSHPQDVLYVV